MKLSFGSAKLAALFYVVGGICAAQSTAPNLTFAYVFAANNNAVTLATGGVIPFPTSPVGSNSSVTFIVANTGTVQTPVKSVGLTGAAFALFDLPLLPASLNPGQQIQFTIAYSPRAAGVDTGTIAISSGGTSYSFGLTATSIASAFIYQAGSTTIPIGGTIQFPDTVVASTKNVQLTVTNLSQVTASISSLTVSGAGFSSLPGQSFPLKIASGDSAIIAVQFAPQSAGPAAGILRLGNDSFNLQGNATNSPPNLTFAYVFAANNNVVTLATGGVIPFGVIPAGSNLSTTFIVANTGTTAVPLQSVSVSGSAFSMSNLPLLPTTLTAGQQIQITITYIPRATGADIGAVAISAAGTSYSFGLSGTAAASAFTYQAGASSIPIGGTVQFPDTVIPGTTSVQLTVTNTSQVSATISSMVVSGAGFSAVPGQSFPLKIAGGDSALVQVQFAPQSAGSATGILRIGNDSFILQASATTSPLNLTFAYVFAANNNAVTITNGGSIPFGSIAAGSKVTATFIVANSGTFAVPLQSVGISGPAFSMSNLPLLPLTLSSGQQIQLAISYSPGVPGADTGGIAFSAGGASYSFSLNGTSIASAFTYQVGSSPLNLNTLQFPDTPVSGTSTIELQVTNVSQAPATIPSISVAGTGFLAGSGQTVPLVVAAGDTIIVPVQFTPQSPGKLTGTLALGKTTFVLQGNGIGSLLTFAYGAGDGSTLLNGGDTILFSPIQLGSSAVTSVTVRNTGTAPVAIKSVFVAGAKSAFRISTSPQLPLTLAPDSSITFGLTFSPQTIGSLTDSLQIDTHIFPISGAGIAPPPLSSFQITGPRDTVSALSQPAIGLSLSTTYPLSISGTLVLRAIPSEFAIDPTVQFASGGQTVAFTIPAGQTDALFNGLSKSIKMQTGTVAGQITITPTFSTLGGFDLTPPGVSGLQMAIADSSPVVLSAQAVLTGSGNISVQVVGYATSRSVTGITLQIQPAAGVAIPSPSIQVDTGTAFSIWYNSSQSAAFGSLFQATIPLTLTSSVSGGTAAGLVSAIVVSATNGLGTSSPVTATVK